MKLISLLLTFLLLNAVAAPCASAGMKAAGQSDRAAKVKKSVARLGTGQSARVSVKLNDGTKLKGHVREAGDDGFVVVDEKTGAASTIAYAQVRQVGGRNLSTGAKIAIGLGIAAAVLGTLVLIGFAHAD